MASSFTILPGDAVLSSYKAPGTLKSFREAMIVGPAAETVFGPEFIAKRAKWLKASEEEYREKTIDYLAIEEAVNSPNLTLVFGHEAFCQINLLTLLALLSQKGRKAPVTIRLINEKQGEIPIREFSFSQFEEAEIWYRALLVEKHTPRPSPNLWPELKKAVTCYLTLQEPQNEITDIIDENPDLPESALLRLLLSWDTDYGLGDDQYLAIICNCRQK